MKIAVIGTQNIGKSTFIDDFITNWPMYKKSSRTYRDIVREQKLSINTEGTEDGQRAILNALIDEVIENKDGEFVIFDRCVLDNLVYTMWNNAKKRVSDEFVKETIDLVRETLVFFDLVFFLPITTHSPVLIEKKEQREESIAFREEIDILFKSLMHAYTKNSNIYFPFKHEKGCPAIIEIFGNPQERIQLAQFYINKDGKIYGEDASLLKSDEPLDEDGKLLAQEVFGIR